MTLNIPDEILQQAGYTEADALTEFACRLFQADMLHLWPGARLEKVSSAS
jgi:hypothetical protein